MSIFTFAETIGNRTSLTKEELDFLLKEHQINEDEALKIIQTMGLYKIQSKDETK